MVRTHRGPVMQTLACPCGAELVVPPGAPSMVCASCMRTHVLATDPNDLGTADTMAAIQFDPKLVPMSQPPPDAPSKMVTRRGVDPSPASRPSLDVIEARGVRGGGEVGDGGAEDARAPRMIDTKLERPPPRLTGHPERAAVFHAQTRARWPLVLGLAIAIAGVVAAIAWFALRGDAPAVTADAAVPDAPRADPGTSPELLLAAEHAALAASDALALEALMRETTFVFGTEASQLVGERKGASSMIAHAVLARPPAGGFEVTTRSSTRGGHGDVAWIVEELEIGGRAFMTSQVAVREGGGWRIAAWHWARLLPNARAIELALANRLAPPAPLEDEPNLGGELEAAVRAAFASRDALLAAIDDGPRTIHAGSAPNELDIGGDAARETYLKVRPAIAIRDRVATGRLSEAAGWGALNVDYTFSYQGKRITQPFRVLCALIKRDARWRIVMLHWSNGGPF